MPSGLALKAYLVAASLFVPVATVIAACSKRGRIRLGERLGYWRKAESCVWWFHGASVGEVTGLIPVISRIRAERPGERILLTTVSPTGLSVAEGLVDELRLLPFDSPGCIRRAFRAIPVQRFVVTETELWPALLIEMQKQGVICDLINGRISDYTVRSYSFFQGVFSAILRNCNSISTITEEDKSRYIALGAPQTRVRVSGNTKYDVAPTVHTQEECRALRERIFPGVAGNTKILVLGSIRPGEETHWFPTIRACVQEGNELKVVVAPRHAEKFDYFADALDTLGIPWRRWSQLQSSMPTAENTPNILLLDAIGVLRSVYSIADLAFVGATLVDIGGHNPLEPAMYGCPVCVGPYVSVIKDVCAEMDRANGLLHITGERDIQGVVAMLFSEKSDLPATGEAGKGVWRRYGGATDQVVATLLGRHVQS